jgi:hypothetical protein
LGMNLVLSSVIRTIGQLQQHGLTAAMLLTLLQACQRKETGRCILHIGQGKIVGFELPLASQEALGERESLTNASYRVDTE